MTPKFVFRPAQGAVPANPEALFSDLSRPPGGPPYLWSHQADLLRSYYERHADATDVAIELPTGAGKTLVGQLIGEWRRRARQERVAYLCPTRQLVAQSVDLARSYGIAVVSMVGDHRDWDRHDVQRFQAGEAMAITTYSTVFNSAPKLNTAQVLILDDAHAGESYVADAWSIRIPRMDPTSLLPTDNRLFHAMLDAVAERLDPVFVQMVRDFTPDIAWIHQVELVPPEFVQSRAEDLVALMQSHDGDHRFPLSLIGRRLGACLVLVSYGEILVRPYVPPTFSLGAFCDAAQRVFMSATLGESGELERAFGRVAVERLPIPRGWERNSAGRRFFVFADRVTDVTGAEAACALVQQVRKALLISPDERSAAKARELLADGIKVLDKNDIEASMLPFARAKEALLSLTNRYDGIDLPDGACRMVVLNQLPAGIHLLERFIIVTLGAGGVLQERIRTRIVQGAGRCTRNPSDYAVVLIVGDRITGFCGMSDVQKAMHPELQAEVAFGWDNSHTDLATVKDNVAAFLGQDAAWKQQVDPRIAEQRAQLERVLPPAATKFREAAPLEVLAVQAAWRGEWSRAVEKAREAATKLAGGNETRTYQALWHFLASQWAAIAVREEGKPEMNEVSRQLLNDALATATRTGWIYRPAHGKVPRADAYSEALIAGAIKRFEGTARVKGTKFEAACESLAQSLDQTDATTFAQGLVQLGRMLGFESVRHDQDAAPDAEWVPDAGAWVTIEAKSEEAPQGQIGVDTVRQTNTHLKWMAEKRGISIPPGSLAVIATPRTEIGATAAGLAEDFVRVVDLEEVRDLAHDTIRAWREIRGRGAGLQGDDLLALVRERFQRNGILGSSLIERLGERHPRHLVRQATPT
jgi:DEAD/DEAH box helicase